MLRDPYSRLAVAVALLGVMILLSGLWQ